MDEDLKKVIDSIVETCNDNGIDNLVTLDCMLPKILGSYQESIFTINNLTKEIERLNGVVNDAAFLLSVLRDG